MNRPLNIDFDSYTDGDESFKLEFITLLISNLNELQQDLVKAIENEDKSIFQITSHKVKPSLIILNDLEFCSLVDDLHNNLPDVEKYKLFENIFEDLVSSLTKELGTTA